MKEMELIDLLCYDIEQVDLLHNSTGEKEKLPDKGLEMEFIKKKSKPRLLDKRYQITKKRVRMAKRT